MSDVIIVGAGAAGIGAAMEFAEHGLKPLMLDVGVERESTPPRAEGNLYNYKEQNDSFELLVGARYQGLANIVNARKVPVKLTVPNAEFVTQRAQDLSPIEEIDFCAIQSFAVGGFANVWGAGLYRFSDRDLDTFPITAAELDPYFDRLTDEIGICGAQDDLTPFFGSTQGLLPPTKISHNVNRIYSKYCRKRKRLPNNFYLGRARVGLLTEPRNGRPAFEYNNLEFWQELPSIYSPRFTLEKLIAADKVDYKNNTLVHSWKEDESGVTVDATDLLTGKNVSFKGRKLFLAAGAINTSRVVLNSFGDHETTLDLYDNPALQMPLVLPSAIGRSIQTDAFGLVQLNLIWDSREHDGLCQGSIMEITSPMRAEFMASLPYTARANLAVIRHLLPSMLVMQIFFPGRAQKPARLSLRSDSHLKIVGHPNTLDFGRLRPLFSFLRSIGAWVHPSLVVRVPMGHPIHYACTLPMKHNPERYQCNPNCELAGTRHVLIGDSASFTDLPAKNMSFAMMANAMRVARHVVETLKV